MKNSLSGLRKLSQKEITKELGAIDFHSHLWDILGSYWWWGMISQDRGNFPIDMRTIWWYMWYGKPWLLINKLLHLWPVERRVLKSWIVRNSKATLANFRKSMDDSWITKAVCLPIPPAITFEDLKTIQDVEDRIIAFTGVDFNKELDLLEIEAEIEQDVLNWAKGMKIHPILQWVSATSKQVNEVVEIFKRHDLPIIFHTWITGYWEDGEVKDNGEISDFEQLAKNHRDAKIVIWHSGLFQVDEAIDRLKGYDNVIMETSFQSSKNVRKIFETFWSDRVVWGSDWPYWDRKPSFQVALDSINDHDILTKYVRTNAMGLMNMV